MKAMTTLQRIDYYLNELEKEKASAHEITTKLCNYEYNMGALYAVYMTAPISEVSNIYDYRRDDRDSISLWFNQNVVNPIYKEVRNSKDLLCD